AVHGRPRDPAGLAHPRRNRDRGAKRPAGGTPRPQTGGGDAAVGAAGKATGVRRREPSMKPTIDCVFALPPEAKVDPAKMVAALQELVDVHFGPAWGVGCTLRVRDQVEEGSWGLRFVPGSGSAEVLGYHDVTPAGMPQGFVFAANEMPSITASHE